MTKLTDASAKQAWVDGTEIARLRKALEKKDHEIEELTLENTQLRAKLQMNRSIVNRHNRVLALKYQGAREAREFERKEALGDKIDCAILGAMIGVFAALWLASWIAFRM